MLERFVENISNRLLFKPSQKILLAVSGGIDSMVMLYLFEKSGFDYGIVHCNFRLRGEESDGDEAFVKKQVVVHGTPSFFKSFDTFEYARINGISIEMAARELRYSYFEEIRSKYNFDYIATAHHADDLIETFFLNLSRKTGIKGLTGIKEKTGNIIRPMLFASRGEIETFADENYIEFREDSSNNEVVFQRNFLRNRILPLFSEINPAFRKNMLASIENLREAETVYSGLFAEEKLKVLKEQQENHVIDIQKLLKTRHPELLLFEILSEYNFNSTVADEVFQSLWGESGKTFYSKTHRLIKDRLKLFVSKQEENESKIYYIEAGDLEIFEPFELCIEKTDRNDFVMSKEPNIACIDLDKLQFPLLIRKWKQGDYFQPLGMTGFKKVSDFFIDQKIPLHEKENTWILFSNNKIVWIMGHRLDNRFKITPKTQKIFKIEIGNNSKT